MSTFRCEIEGCDHTDRGNARWCRMHYMRWWKHGDPMITLASHNFVGDAIGYHGAHQRVRTSRGAASEHTCVNCGDAAKHWAYNHADPRERVDDRGRAYSPNPAYYQPMCISCHKKADIAHKPPALVRDERGVFRSAL